jgi:hypothetical protein
VKKLPDGRDTGRRILVTTQVGQSPSDVTQECSLKMKTINKCSQKNIKNKLTEVSGLIKVSRCLIMPCSLT